METGARGSLLAYSATYWQEHALKRFVERASHGVIKGFFGGGKTLATVKTVRKLAEKGDRESYILAFPLRRLRDYVARNWMYGGAFVFKAHDEVCPALAKRLKEDPSMGYLQHLARHVEEDTCNWHAHIEELVDALEAGSIVVTTHTGGLIAKVLSRAVNRNPNVFFDEAEDFLVQIREGVWYHELKAVAEVSPRLYQRLKRMYKRDSKKAFLHPREVISFLRSFLISATPPKTMIQLIEDATGGEPVPVHMLSARAHLDTIVAYDRVLPWASAGDWKRRVYPALVSLVSSVIDRIRVVGIVSRNYDMTRELRGLFEASGYKVSCDLDDNIDRSAEVFILTTLGRLYRGVSIFPSRSPQSDFPLIIGFYQGRMDGSMHPFVMEMLSYWGEELEQEHRQELLMARNLQALYRFNRVRGNRHVMVLFDARYTRAYRTYFPHYFYTEWKVKRYDSIDNVIEEARRQVLDWW